MQYFGCILIPIVAVAQKLYCAQEITFFLFFSLSQLDNRILRQRRFIFSDIPGSCTIRFFLYAGGNQLTTSFLCSYQLNNFKEVQLRRQRCVVRSSTMIRCENCDMTNTTLFPINVTKDAGVGRNSNWEEWSPAIEKLKPIELANQSLLRENFTCFSTNDMFLPF